MNLKIRLSILRGVAVIAEVRFAGSFANLAFAGEDVGHLVSYR